MKSPFPGMDPWLEAHWGDVHSSLAIYTRDELQPQLPPDLRARVEEYVAVEAEDVAGGFYPDVRVVERPFSAEASSVGGAAAAVAEPLVVPLSLEPETIRSVRIIDPRADNRVVTAIEFFSPSNKLREEGREAYRKKRRELLAGGVNLVEIDLLRGGAYLLAIPEDALPAEYVAPYRIAVVRPTSRPRGEVSRASLREPLPTIYIPLRETDPDVFLNIQSILNGAYQNGGYDDLDYTSDPAPPLRGEDADWADALLRRAGRR
ncbi:MAG TPA: DUF4058 family protein [Planctomycetaceae bacterium]|nr:DUF4058 family protein [Planctomycetaceae bacterium]